MENQINQQSQGGQQSPPSNNLVWAILSMLYCCLPLGIVSLVHATKVDSLWSSGFHEQAYKEAGDAKKWAKYALIAGIVFWVLYLAVCVVIIVASSSSRYYYY